MELKARALKNIELADELTAHAEEQLSYIVNKLASPKGAERTDELLNALETAALLPHLIKVIKLVIFDSVSSGEELQEVVEGSQKNLNQISYMIGRVTVQVAQIR